MAADRYWGDDEDDSILDAIDREVESHGSDDED